jgi:hypothetical protein
MVPASACAAVVWGAEVFDFRSSPQIMVESDATAKMALIEGKGTLEEILAYA